MAQAVGKLRHLQYDGPRRRPSLIAPYSRLDDGQFDLRATVELPAVGVVNQGQRPVGPAQSPFRVGHQRQVADPPGEPPRGPQFCQGVGPATGLVGGHSGGLTDVSHPRRELRAWTANSKARSGSSAAAVATSQPATASANCPGNVRNSVRASGSS